MFQYGMIVLTSTQFISTNPIIPPDVVAISSDDGTYKIGDGITAWASLDSYGLASIGSVSISANTASPNDLMYVCGASNTWKFRKWGCVETETNWNAYATTVFPTFTLLIETSDSTGVPTGRFKIGDGTHQFNDLPWTGSGLAISGTEGDMIVHNGSEWVVLSPGEEGQVLVCGGPGVVPSWEYIGV